MTHDPHGGQPVRQAGPPLEHARAAAVLVHGRGGTADGMLELARVLDVPDVAYLAPQAAGNTWYPFPFMVPIARNEPGLSSGLAVLAGLLPRVAAAGVPPRRTVLVGFSQGACLSLEFVAREAPELAGVAGLAGGLIGPPDTPRDYPGRLDGLSVFLGCGDPDPHIPAARVMETAETLQAMGANVTSRLYPGLGHTVNADQIARVHALLERAALGAPET
jgi:predicted esterase